MQENDANLVTMRCETLLNSPLKDCYFLLNELQFFKKEICYENVIQLKKCKDINSET